MMDFRYAIRTLRSTPAFSLAALVVLALGLGANGAMFALVDAVLLRPLPVPEPARLAVVTYTEPDSPGSSFTLSYPDYLDLRDGVPAFSGVLACSGLRLSVSQSGRSERVRGQVVTADYFKTLGVQPYLGRLLAPDDDRVRGGSPVAVLDHGFWQRLGGDRGLVGRDLLVNGRSLTVVGVAPPDFYGTDLASRTDVYVPMSMAPILRPNRADPDNMRRGHQWLQVMARLRPGVALEQAQAAAAVTYRRSVEARLAEMSPRASERDRSRLRSRHLELRPGDQGTARMRRSAQKPMLLLTGSTAILLLIACANLGNLLLARGAARQRELSLRLALGGTRFRIGRQLFAESLVLSVAGGAAGLVVSSWVTSAVLGFLPAGNGLGTDLPFAPGVVAATFGLALVTAFLFGLVPAWRTTRMAPAATLKADAPTVAAEGRGPGLRQLLIGVQVAMSFLLLLGAGLFLRTEWNLLGVDTGFARGNVLVATVDPSLNGYPAARSAEILSEFVRRVEALPGVRRAGLSSVSPITGSWDVNDITVAGYQAKDGEETDASFASVSPGYLEAMGIAVVHGRSLTWRDVEGAPLVAVVNETMAREYFGGSALGRRFSFSDDKATIEIVGVVRDGKYTNLREEKAPRFAYVSFRQFPIGGSDMTLHARTDGDPLQMVGGVRTVLGEIDATLPLAGITTLDEQVNESLAGERILATLGTSFGFLALLLAAVGVYGVLAFAVARRTREIGVRMALGAAPRDVSWLVTRQVAATVFAGLLAGGLGGWALQGVLRSVLFGVSAADPVVFAAAALLVAATAAAAALLPARRAARLDPLAALRHD
jgi:predicted permease